MKAGLGNELIKCEAILGPPLVFVVRCKTYL